MLRMSRLVMGYEEMGGQISTWRFHMYLSIDLFVDGFMDLGSRIMHLFVASTIFNLAHHFDELGEDRHGLFQSITYFAVYGL